MITLHRNEKDPKADKIEKRLNDLVLAYRVEANADDSESFIEDGGQKIMSEEKIESWFQELESELEWQRSLSSDACYIDPGTGKVC